MQLDYKAIGRRIKTARINANLTQEALADHIGLSTSHMSNIETGTTRVSLVTIVNLANALGVTVDDLLSDNIIRARIQLEQDLQELLQDCDDYEIRIVRDVVQSVLVAIRRNEKLKDT